MASFVRRLCAALLVLFALAPAYAQPADPLAPARSGMVMCYEPNAATHSCGAMGAYTFGQDGRVTNQATVLVATQPLVIMNGASQVTVRDGAVCGAVTAADMASATFTINGAPASDANTTILRNQMTENFETLGEVCSTYARQGSNYSVVVTLQGTPHPEMASAMSWVSPSDGYAVRP